jgi:hypothetical protein
LPGTKVTSRGDPSDASQARAGAYSPVSEMLRFEIRHDAREHVAAMNDPALAPPVEEAGRTFADELGQSGRRQRSEMGVRQMREDEHGTDRDR